MKLKIKLLPRQEGSEVKMPFYATEGSAGFDLSAYLDQSITLMPSERALIPTGLALQIPEGYAGLVYARSGLAIKSGITLSNCVGVIDSDYRGEVKVGLVNLSDKPFTIHDGDRVAQLVLTPVVQAEIETTDEISETQRGDGGFGSTGIKGKNN